MIIKIYRKKAQWTEENLAHCPALWLSLRFKCVVEEYDYANNNNKINTFTIKSLRQFILEPNMYSKSWEYKFMIP